VTTLTECQCIVIGNVCALHVSEVPEKSVLVSVIHTSYSGPMFAYCKKVKVAHTRLPSVVFRS